MAKMTDTQRYVVLSLNEAPANRGILTANRHSTIKALVANKWATYPKSWPSSTRRVARSAYVTFKGLIAAGYDIDAVHAEALAEHDLRAQVAEQCGCLRNPLGHSRAEHPLLAEAERPADTAVDRQEDTLRGRLEKTYGKDFIDFLYDIQWNKPTN